jgi:hypothetical protein
MTNTVIKKISPSKQTIREPTKRHINNQDLTNKNQKEIQ